MKACREGDSGREDKALACIWQLLHSHNKFIGARRTKGRANHASYASCSLDSYSGIRIPVENVRAV